MSRPAVGFLAAALIALASLAVTMEASAQSALANCKYYTKVQQDFEQGLPHCAKCIEDEPDNPEARFYGAWCLAEQGKWDQAWTSFNWLTERKDHKDKNIRKHAKMAASRISGYFAEHFNKGVEYLNAGAEQYPAAEQEFKIATSINPRQPDAFLNLGFTRNELGDIDGALKAFEDAIVVDPNRAMAYEFYSVALGKKQKTMQAEETPDEAALAEIGVKLKATLEKVVAGDPANDAALLQLGDIALREGDQTVAIDYIQRAIDVDPNNVVELFNIAVGFYKKEKFEAAAETFGMVADQEDDPDSDLWRDAKYYCALSFRSNDQHDMCLALVNELIEINPDEKDYHSLASQLYMKQKNLVKANEHVERYEALLAAEGGNQ